MKKITAMLLALMMLLSLCACGDDAVKGSVTPAETPAAGDAPAEEPEAEVEIGAVNGGTYENAFIGVGCTLDESWTYYGQEELAEMAGITAEQLGDEEFAEQMKNADMFYDMYAYAEEGLYTMNIVVEKLNPVLTLALDEEAYIDATLENLATQLASAGFEDVVTEKNTITFAGEERTGVYFTATVQGMPYYCQQVCIKAGSHMAAISVASFYNDITSQMTEYFFAVD